MPSPTAQECLQRYAFHGDEAAFSQLVRGQAPLVWRTAMRRLGDAQLAEEAMQNVFLALARKSSRLARRPGLIAWLHRAATLEASSLARSRDRREKRLTRLVCQSTSAPAASPPDSPAGPWLDEALNRLPAADRTLLLGRYFEDRTFDDLASTLGKSPDAAKKQTRRALEKMAAHLRRRGITLSAAALASLTANGFSPAPVPAFSSPTFPPPPASSPGSWLHQILTVMSSAKATTGAAALLLLLLTAIFLQSFANTGLRQELHTLQDLLTKRNAALQLSRTVLPETGIAPGVKPFPPLPDPLDAAVLMQLSPLSSEENPQLRTEIPPEWHAEFLQRRMAADVAQIRQWLQTIMEDNTVSESVKFNALQGLVWEELLRRSPVSALKVSMEYRFNSSRQRFAMSQLAAQDFPTALEFLKPSSMDTRTRAGGESTETALLQGIGDYFAQNRMPWFPEPGDESGEEGKSQESFLTFAGNHLADPGFAIVMEAAAARLNPSDATRFLELSGQLPETADQEKVLSAVLAAPMRYGGLGLLESPGESHAMALEFLNNPAFPAALRESTLRAAATQATGSGVWAAMALVHGALPPDRQPENLARVAEFFASQRPADLENLPKLGNAEARAVLDETLAATARALASNRNTGLASDIAAKIQDDTLRQQILNALP